MLVQQALLIFATSCVYKQTLYLFDCRGKIKWSRLNYSIHVKILVRAVVHLSKSASMHVILILATIIATMCHVIFRTCALMESNKIVLLQTTLIIYSVLTWLLDNCTGINVNHILTIATMLKFMHA